MVVQVCMTVQVGVSHVNTCIYNVGGAEIQRDILEAGNMDTPTMKVEEEDNPG